MANISATDVAKLRKMTGAGMMDCKNALTEADGNFDTAIDLLRKKGQKVAGNRADREATEGAVIAELSADKKTAVITVLNCETDFVAKNDDFVKFAKEIAAIATSPKVNSLDELKVAELNGKSIESEVINQTGVIGEKIDLSYFDKIQAAQVSGYIHIGNKLATIVGFSKNINETSAREIAMQIAAMNPVAVDEKDVPKDVIEKEIEIGKDQAIQEGKTVEMAEKIAVGKLQKFYKESTLLNQQFIKDNKITVKEFLKSVDTEITVTEFRRYSLA
jgi:elongation factor Ts